MQTHVQSDTNTNKDTDKHSYSDINRPTRRRLKIAGVEERTGVHRQTIWRWYKVGLFPTPHYLGSERMWFEDEIETWEAERMAQRAAEKGAA
jgi:predicted DNA-binding transcriptional regulator AlpA